MMMMMMMTYIEKKDIIGVVVEFVETLMSPSFMFMPNA